MSSTESARPPRRRLGQLLVDDGALTDEQLAEALQVQRADNRRRRLGRVLRDLNLVDEFDMAAALARQLGLQRADLNARPTPPPSVVDMVPRRIAEAHKLLPLEFDEESGRLIIAMADPTNVLAMDDLRTVEGVRRISIMVAPESGIERGIVRAYEQDTANRAVEELGIVEEVEDDTDLGSEAGDEPVIRLVNALLADAVRSRASDVHVEPERDGMRVRVRIDGMLRETQHIPRALAASVTSRLKIMSSLDIAERRRPQDGRAAIRVDGQEVDLRVSTMPSMFGETTVLRLLRKGAERYEVDDLGFSEHQLELFNRALNQSQGMILMTGPTGSGKTTTLYAGLAELAAPTRNVVTLEDPIEYQLSGVNQTQMQPKIGMTFAAGLRTILRQDPDVIMVGEIRDAETAQLAVESSFTGHLVLSTLHTNDAPSTVARLAELEVERFLLATTLTLIVAQRLARTVCPHCAGPYTPPEAVLEQLGLTPDDVRDTPARRGAGCGHCSGSGYLGRVGLYEFLYLTPRLRQLISDGGTELQLAALARAEGLVSLRRDGIRKAMQGMTTFEEIVRTTPEDAFLAPRTAATPATDDDETVAAQRRAVEVGALQAARLLVAGTPALLVEAGEALPPGWELSTATSVREALSRARTERPDLLLLEHHLADGTAFDVLRPLRDSDHDHTPAIVRRREPMSEQELVEASVLGVTDHVDGDLGAEALQARLEAALVD